MQAEVIAALIGAGASLAVAILTYVHARQSARDAAEEQRRQAAETAALQREQAHLAAEQARQLTLLQAELERRAREEEERSRRQELVSRFREPLAQAAYALQSRLWNILEGAFLDTYMVQGNDREKAYAIDNTLFVIAQYFAWTEIIRNEIQFIDLGEQEATRELAHLQDRITGLWGTDRGKMGPQLRIWAGEQRAIGEILLREGPRGPCCLGFGAFQEILNAGSSPLLTTIQGEIAALSPLGSGPRKRLRLLQHALIDLLNYLDPDGVRFPPESRSRIEPVDQGL